MKNTCIIRQYRNTLSKLLFWDHLTNFSCLFMVFRVGFRFWIFSNEILPLSRAFCRVLYLFSVMPKTHVMCEILMFFKVFKPLNTFKNMSISLITWVIGIAQKTYSTLLKALDIDNISLENIQNRNPTLKTLKMQLKLFGWWQKSNLLSVFLYYLIIHVFFICKEW